MYPPGVAGYPPFSAGDCLEIDFQPIAAYDPLKAFGADYVIWPGTLNTPGTPDCTGLTPAGITCELVTNSRIKMTIGATSAAVIGGGIPGMQNPMSTYQLKVNHVNYKSAAGLGCAKQTADLSTQAVMSSGYQIIIDPGTIPVANIAITLPTDTAIVGDASLLNLATFDVTPGSTFSVYGGRIGLSGPAWYSSKRNADYYWGQPGFTCSCA